MEEIKWKKTVGIVGGFGPYSTLDFERMMFDYCREKLPGMRANEGYPPMITRNCNFIPFIIDGVDKRLNPELLSIMKKLQHDKADFLVIPSNTPHIFFDELASSVDIPVLNIVEEAVKAVNERSGRRVGIIATHPEVNELYRKHLSEHDIELESPNEDTQKRITPFIEGFMAGRREGAKDFFVGLMDIFRDLDTIILACTELPEILGDDMKKYRTIDTMRVLAKATVGYALT